MKVTRRQFLQGSAAAFTISFAAPEFLSDVVRAQGAHTRNFVILYLSGGNDALSMLVPYNDPFYYSRRPSLAVPAGTYKPAGVPQLAMLSIPMFFTTPTISLHGVPGSFATADPYRFEEIRTRCPMAFRPRSTWSTNA